MVTAVVIAVAMIVHQEMTTGSIFATLITQMKNWRPCGIFETPLAAASRWSLGEYEGGMTSFMCIMKPMLVLGSVCFRDDDDYERGGKRKRASSGDEGSKKSRSFSRCVFIFSSFYAKHRMTLGLLKSVDQ